MNDKLLDIVAFIQANSISGERWRKYSNDYFVSTKGRVISIIYQKIIILSQQMNDYGYYRVSINSRWYLVSRLMAETFYNSFDETMEVHHRNFDTKDNRLSNLQPLSPEEHRAEHKRIKEQSQKAESERAHKWNSLRDWGVFW